MDFYFTEKSHSARFVDFLEGVVPTKASADREPTCFDHMFCRIGPKSRDRGFSLLFDQILKMDSWSFCHLKFCYKAAHIFF